MKGELLFSLKKKDFEIEFYRGSGKGGQNRNKVETGVRIKHPASGAVAQACEQRTQGSNRSIAFRRLVETPEFKKWHKLECAKAFGRAVDINELVERWMDESNLKIETQDENGRWVEIK
jgi:protein subunit release factor A